MSHRKDNKTPRLLQGLCERIHRERPNYEQQERSRYFKQLLLRLFLCALPTLLLQLHTQMYNVALGPFHFNHEQLANHLASYSQDLRSSLERWFWLYKEYLQIEIGENHIEIDILYIPDASGVKDIYRVNELGINDGLFLERLFIRLTNETQIHTRTRHPYRFQAFTIRTLRCTVRHLGVRPWDYMTWQEKTMYVRDIEKHYAANPTHFNTVVAPACGMLIGYLYRPMRRRPYRLSATFDVQFDEEDVGLETSLPYCSYQKVFAGVVLACLVLESLFYLMAHLAHSFWPSPFVLSADIQAELDKLNVDSLPRLNELLFATSEERNYYDRLFIIRERYLVFLHVDWNEHDPKRLEQFDTRSPFIVHALASITKVESNGFFIGNTEKQASWVSFPAAADDMDESAASWLHRQMMSLDERYRKK